jgi:phytoene synthase
MIAAAAESTRPSQPSGGSNFFVAFRVLPPERREAIRAVYRFCRRADDAVDDAADRAAGRAALGRVAALLDRVYDPAGETGEETALRRAIARFDLPREPFDDLLEGVSWDLEGRRYEETRDLREYCYRVASTVGLLCVRIFGCRGDSCDGYAEELGVALQWTNILRDVGVDLSRGRVYLTQRSLSEHGLTDDDLRRGDAASRSRLAALVRAEAAYARGLYAEAERRLPPKERQKVLAGEIMAAVYRRLLRRVERNAHGVLDRPVRLSSIERGCVAAGALLRRRLGPARRATM